MGESLSSSVANIDRPSTCTVCTAKLMPKYRMTASTTTSASSRSSDEPAEVRGWSAATAGCWGAAMKFLGDELSADPFQLLLTRVTQLDLSPLETAADLHRHAEPGFGLGGDASKLRRRIPTR